MLPTASPRCRVLSATGAASLASYHERRFTKWLTSYRQARESSLTRDIQRGSKEATCPVCGMGRLVGKAKRSNSRCLDCEIWALNLQRAAQVTVGRAIRAGDLPHPSTLACADCGVQATEYDHRDYRQPLKVDPTCRGCNARRGPAHPLRKRA